MKITNETYEYELTWDHIKYNLSCGIVRDFDFKSGGGYV